jgi:hypothetical protein
MKDAIWTQEELIDSRECFAPRVPLGWAFTELTDQELQECYQLMAQDYKQLGDPFQGGLQ